METKPAPHPHPVHRRRRNRPGMLSPAKEAQLFGVKDRCFQTWGGKAKRLILGRADGAFFIRECNIGDAGSHFSEAGKKVDWKVCPCSVRTHGRGSWERPELSATLLAWVHT